MKKILLIMILLVSSFSYSQEEEEEEEEESVINNLIEDAKSLIDKIDLDNIIPEYEYEFGVLYIRNATLAKAKRVNAVGMVHYFFLSSSDGDKRLNNLPNRITKWPLLLGGEGNEMKLIANKLNEGWEIVQMNQLEKGVSVSGTSLGDFPVGWIVHFKRRVKK